MAKKNHFGEAEILEIARVRLENVEKQPTISELMAEYGYDSEKITEGKTIRTKAEEAYYSKKKEDNETSEVHRKLEGLIEKITKYYSKDRKIAKALFDENTENYKRLVLTGSIPESYVKWSETVKTFYTESLASEAIQNSLAILKVTVEHLNEVAGLIVEMETCRADYLRERGESMDATSLKENAFADLDDWMIKFRRVAKIALEDHPQLLEALQI